MALQEPLRGLRPREKREKRLSLGRSKAPVRPGCANLDLLKASFQARGINARGWKG